MAMPDKDKVTGTSASNANSSNGHNRDSDSVSDAHVHTAADSSRSAAGENPAPEGVTEVDAQVIDVDELMDEINEAADADRLVKAQAEVEEWKSKYMRLHAEWDTYRRRTTEQRQEEKARATEKLVESLLPVIDDFERTIDYAQKNGEAGLFEGVCAVHSKFVDTLIKDGVDVINPQGEAFDALKAQVVAVVEDASVCDETVAEVYQKGYRMGKKVLRPAMVTVTSGGPKREEPTKNEE